jgi:Capsule polysaccharide biosynthesis protein
MAYKIALYGFGAFPVVQRHLIELAAMQKLPIEWCAILPLPNYRAALREVLPASEILDVFEALPRTPVGGDLADLARYPGSLVEDLAAQKNPRRKRTAQWVHNRGIDYYRLYKTFLAERGATHLLTSVIETSDAKIAVAAAQELGIPIIAPVDMRNLSGTYFAVDSYETPPPYAVATAETRVRAAEFVQAFRNRATRAHGVPADAEWSGDDQAILPTYMPSLWNRAKGFVGAVLERPDLFDPELLRVAVMRNFHVLRTAVRGTRERVSARQFDIADADSLPKRFIFCPLHYSPEASINVPAPFFIDQLRIVDALRYSMPSDCVLVVKEHPACIRLRPLRVMRQIRARPGVLAAKVSLPSQELVKRAALTATVTGTAALEALLLGRPALALGRALPGWVLGRPAEFENLPARITEAMATPVNDDVVIDQVAKLMSARYPFYHATAHMPGEPMLRRGNIRRFLAALVDHLERGRGHRVQVG